MVASIPPVNTPNPAGDRGASVDGRLGRAGAIVGGAGKGGADFLKVAAPIDDGGGEFPDGGTPIPVSDAPFDNRGTPVGKVERVDPINYYLSKVMKPTPLIAILAITTASALTAANITLTAHGTINGVTNPSFWDSSITNGAPVQLTITYDGSKPDGNLGDPREGYFSGSGAPWSSSLTVGDYTFSDNSAYLFIYNDAPSPYGAYGYQTGVGFGSLNQNGLHAAGFLWMMLSNSSLAGLISDQFPIHEYPVTDFSFRDFRLSGLDSNNQTTSLFFTPTSYAVQGVPEPTTGLVGLAVGAAALLSRRRRRVAC